MSKSHNILPTIAIFFMSNARKIKGVREFKIKLYEYRGRSRAVATSKMERFVIIVNRWKPLTIITKRSILDVAAALDSPLE